MKLSINKEFRNAGWIIGEQVFQMLVSLIVGVLSARYLGPSNYGLINYTGSFVTFVTSITTLGMDSVVIKKMIESPQREGEYLGSCMVYRLVAALVSSAGIISVVWVLNPGDTLMLTLVSLQSIQLFFRAISLLDAWFQRHLKSKYVSLAKMLACVIVSAYRICLLIFAKDIRWFALSNTLTAAVTAIVLIVAYARQRTQKLSFSFPAANDTLKDSYHFIISGLMTAIYGQMDRIMLGEMMSAESVGLYTTAATICTMWLFVPTAIIHSLQPGILECKKSGNESAYLHRLKRLYAIIIWLCIVVSLGVFVFGDLAVRILYGEAYAGAAGSLKILIWSETFAMIGSMRGVWILAEKKNKYVKHYLGMGAALNLLVNFLLIPRLGIAGASAATLATQIFTSLIAPLLFKATRVHTKLVLQAVVYPFSPRR